jgi:hypothetical protein
MIRSKWPWKVVFYLPGCFMILMVPVYLSTLFGYWGLWILQLRAYAQIVTGAILCPWILVAALKDYRRDKQGDWLHWLGVLVAAGLAAAFVLNGIYSSFLI